MQDEAHRHTHTHELGTPTDTHTRTRTRVQDEAHRPLGVSSPDVMPGEFLPPFPPPPSHSVLVDWPRGRIIPLRVGPGGGLRIAKANHEHSEFAEVVYVVHKFAEFLVLEVPGHTNSVNLQ